MTPNEITTLIASTLERELDVPFRLQLMDRVKYWRSRLIANALQKNPAQRKFFRQSLFLKMAPALNVPCAALIACEVAQTTAEVPTLVRVGSQLFDYIGGVDGNSPWKEVMPGMGTYQEGKFAHNFMGYEFVNQRIVVSKKDTPMVLVHGVFDDPMKVAELSCTCSEAVEDCDAWNKEFPMSGDITQLVVQSILQVDYNRRPIVVSTTQPVEVNPQING